MRGALASLGVPLIFAGVFFPPLLVVGVVWILVCEIGD